MSASNCTRIAANERSSAAQIIDRDNAGKLVFAFSIWLPRICHDARPEMRLPTIIVRLVGLLVLLVSVSDYWAYDRWDPTAPMNASGPETMELVGAQKAPSASLNSTALPDDHCLCCSPVVAPPAPVLPIPSFFSFAHQVGYSLRSEELRTSAFRASLPFCDSTGFDRPLRV